MCELCNIGKPYGASASFENALYNALMADFKPSYKINFVSPTPPASSSPAPTPVPSSYGVSTDLHRIAKERVSVEDAAAHLENVEGALETAKSEVEDRRLIEKALKATAKLERRNIAARRFILAYRAISGGSMVTLAGVEFGGSGKVHLAGNNYPFGNTHDSLDALRRAALAKGYYVAVSYVDKD